MKKPLKLILQGLITVLPLALTLYFLYWLITQLEAITRPLLVWLLPGIPYFPGLGLLTALLILMAVGLLVNAYAVQLLINFGDRLMERIPLVKSLYGAIKDMMMVFRLSDKKQMGAVVTVDMGNDMHLIGFVTGEKAGRRLFKDREQALVGVYLPMSYQVGGFTVYLPRDRLTELDIGIETAMRIALTGGIQQKPQDDSNGHSGQSLQ